mmetsp:Transcript_17536/g.15810  ORF Transcript_17536/g.15810 Transcript_17536/m.15810 type:complete len:115 (+) Transcript_17536:193-537(+)
MDYQSFTSLMRSNEENINNSPNVIRNRGCKRNRPNIQHTDTCEDLTVVEATTPPNDLYPSHKPTNQSIISKANSNTPLPSCIFDIKPSFLTINRNKDSHNPADWGWFIDTAIDK